MHVRLPKVVCPLLACLFGAGCGDRPIAMPKISPKAAAQQALSQADTNRDGIIAHDEFATQPGLLAMRARADATRDEALTPEEIEDRLKQYLAFEVPAFPVVCKVTKGGVPLAGASVTFEPEPFLASAIRPATGTTDERGLTMLRVDGMEHEVIYFGVYRVRISKVENGQETLPAHYNVQTQFGVDVSVDNRDVEAGLTFDVK